MVKLDFIDNLFKSLKINLMRRVSEYQAWQPRSDYVRNSDLLR